MRSGAGESLAHLRTQHTHRPFEFGAVREQRCQRSTHSNSPTIDVSNWFIIKTKSEVTDVPNRFIIETFESEVTANF